MSERPMVSAAALTAFNAYLPSDLTETQAEKVILAASVLARQVWQEATSAQVVLAGIQREYRTKPDPDVA